MLITSDTQNNHQSIMESERSEQQVHLLNTSNGGHPSIIIKSNESVAIELDFKTTQPQASSSSSTSDDIKAPIKYKLSWMDFSCTLPSQASSCCQRKSMRKLILQPQSGAASSGQVTAILGKSGAGKSTLLQCLAGKRRSGVKGQMSINPEPMKSKDIRLAYLPQSDQLYPNLSVKESLIFASKLKNLHSDKRAHMLIVGKLLADLDLIPCSNVRVGNCSGGQCKRLSIALELIGNPKILLLDEPTSGLDSSSATQCIELLRNLAENPINPLMILLTVHQPSARILFTFHQMYLLSHNGRCIYSGSVDGFIPRLESVKLFCPRYHNPADFALEISSGDHGEEAIDALVTAALNDHIDINGKNDETENESSKSKKKEEGFKYPLTRYKPSKMSFFSNFRTLLLRTVLINFRNPVFNAVRFVTHAFLATIIASIYDESVGQTDGCLFDHSDRKFLGRNRGFFFYCLFMLTLAAITPTVMTFPLEIHVYLKERRNGWYSCLSYFLAKSLADLPFQIFCIMTYITITYPSTGQINVLWRFSLFSVIALIHSLITESIGLIVGSLMSKNVNTAVFTAILSSLPSFILSGFFVNVEEMPDHLQEVSYLSFSRHALEAMSLVIYGFNRCDPNLKPENYTFQKSSNGVFEMMTRIHDYSKEFLSHVSIDDIKDTASWFVMDNNKSLTQFENIFNDMSKLNMSAIIEGRRARIAGMTNEAWMVKKFKLKDSDLVENILVMLVTFVIFRVLAYLALLWKSRDKK